MTKCTAKSIRAHIIHHRELANHHESKIAKIAAAKADLLANIENAIDELDNIQAQLDRLDHYEKMNHSKAAINQQELEEWQREADAWRETHGMAA